MARTCSRGASANTAGEGNKELHRILALTGREIDSFLWPSASMTPTSSLGMTSRASGTVTAGLFADVVEIDTRTGTQSQTAIADLVAAFPRTGRPPTRAWVGHCSIPR